MLSRVDEKYSLPTVPAWVALWLLKPSGDVSKGNPLKDVHGATEPKTNVVTLHQPSLCVHRPELQKLCTKEYEKCT